MLDGCRSATVVALRAKSWTVGGEIMICRVVYILISRSCVSMLYGKCNQAAYRIKIANSPILKQGWKEVRKSLSE
jgi:hypothetical protein